MNAVDDDKLTSDEVAEVAKRIRGMGVIEPLVEAVERVAERVKRRENAELSEELKPKEVRK